MRSNEGTHVIAMEITRDRTGALILAKPDPVSPQREARRRTRERNGLGFRKVTREGFIHFVRHMHRHVNPVTRPSSRLLRLGFGGPSPSSQKCGGLGQKNTLPNIFSKRTPSIFPIYDVDLYDGVFLALGFYQFPLPMYCALLFR